jgi:acetyltransferase-like isoleucine patch superfamily enzyme
MTEKEHMTRRPPLPLAAAADPFQLVARAVNWLYKGWLQLTYPFSHLGKRLSVHHRCSINRKAAHRIWLGNDVRLGKDVYLGISAPLDEVGPPVLIIDNDSLVHWRSQIDAKNLIHIERDVLITQDVLIIDHGHAYEDVSIPVEEYTYTEGGTIRIGEGSWIGHGAAIICSQGDLVLGRHCVVAANAVVTRSAPPYSVLSGNPARIVKQYDPSKKAWVLGGVRASEVQTVS